MRVEKPVPSSFATFSPTQKIWLSSHHRGANVLLLFFDHTKVRAEEISFLKPTCTLQLDAAERDVHDEARLRGDLRQAGAVERRAGHRAAQHVGPAALSEHTVKSHVGSIFQKLSVTDRAGAISAAVRRNLGGLSTTRES